MATESAAAADSEEDEPSHGIRPTPKHVATSSKLGDHDGLPTHCTLQEKMDLVVEDPRFHLNGVTRRWLSDRELSQLAQPGIAHYDCPTPWCAISYQHFPALIKHITRNKCSPRVGGCPCIAVHVSQPLPSSR
jgi:hypothetical protein